MKYLMIALLIVFYCPAAIAGNGSFLILKSTYLYQTRDQKGKKILTREKQAYTVLNIYTSKGSSAMLEIEFDKKTDAINGSGFIVENESELKEMGLSDVKVYLEMPSKQSDLTNYKLVPSNQLSFIGRQESSSDFPNLSWKAVNFKANVPLRVWIPEWAGIYRPDKEASWLNQIYAVAILNNLTGNLLDKILNGQVEPGFTKEQVRMALGNPGKEQLIEDDTKLEWIYGNRKVIFVNSIVSRVL
jgi:hypothetical protein